MRSLSTSLLWRPADDRMRYEEAKNHRKLCDALKEAASLLANLGQGDPVPWSPWQKVQRSLIGSPARIQPMRGYEVVFREREDGAIFELLLPPLPPAPGASDD